MSGSQSVMRDVRQRDPAENAARAAVFDAARRVIQFHAQSTQRKLDQLADGLHAARAMATPAERVAS